MSKTQEILDDCIGTCDNCLDTGINGWPDNGIIIAPCEECNSYLDGSGGIAYEDALKAMEMYAKYCIKKLKSEVEQLEEHGLVYDTYSGEVPMVEKELVIDIINKHLSE